MDWIDEIALSIYCFLDLIGALPTYVRKRDIRPICYHPLYREDLYFRVQVEFQEFLHHPTKDLLIRVLVWMCILSLHYPDELEA